MCDWRTIRREKQKAAEAVFEKIQVRNFASLGRDNKWQIQEAHTHLAKKHTHLNVS